MQALLLQFQLLKMFFGVKADFHDHIYLRYCWPFDDLPSSYPCGEWFTVEHTKICKLLGFIYMHHDDPTDFIASCIKEVYNNIEVELKLQPFDKSSHSSITPQTQTLILEWTYGRGVFGSKAEMHVVVILCLPGVYSVYAPGIQWIIEC